MLRQSMLVIANIEHALWNFTFITACLHSSRIMLQHLKAVYNERFVSSVDSVREPRY